MAQSRRHLRLRLSEEMVQRLEALRAKSGRTMTGEIAYYLERALWQRVEHFLPSDTLNGAHLDYR